MANKTKEQNVSTEKKVVKTNNDVEELISNDTAEKTVESILADNEPTSEFESIRIKKFNWPLVLVIILTFIIITGGFVTWMILTVDRYIMNWGPEDITFYSQMPFYDYGRDEFFDSKHIDGGFNEEVYNGSEEYSHFKNKRMNVKSKIGITQSMTWSDSPNDYLDPFWGIDAQFNSGVKTLVSSGFNIAAAVDSLHRNLDGEHEGYSDADFIENGWKTIIIDDNFTATQYESATSVFFESAEAGFIAGLAASVYTIDNVLNGTTENDDIVIWGGDSFNTVYDWMSGFEQAVNYMNYVVLGVDVDDTLHSTSEETLGLLENMGVTNDDYIKGMDITNGYSLTPDYTTGFTTNNSEFGNVQTNYKNTWYNGAFDSDITEGSGLIAKNRTSVSINNGVSTIFPVAGGQTMIASSMINDGINDGGTNTRVIGVDVDGTTADPSNANSYLGSATKNLRNATSLAIWSQDDERRSVKKDPNFGGITLDDFETEHSHSDAGSKGWKISQLDDGTVVKGNLYMGDIENGGLGFETGVKAENGSSLLDDSFNSLVSIITNDAGLTIPEEINSFKDLVMYAYDENIEKVGMIENSSNTFTPSGISPTTPKGATYWIPDWDIYKNKYYL